MRRNAFASLQENEINNSIASINSQVPTMNTIQKPMSALDFIPSAVPKKKRDRKWERENKDQVATYRGITPEVRQSIILLAEKLNVSTDDVARAFLENGIGLYQSGQIVLNPYPKAQRMTLFPSEKRSKGKENNGWLQEAVQISKQNGKRKKKQDQKNWEYRVSYRIPPAVKESIKTIAERHTVPIGEVVLYFFQHAFAAYQTGKLVLSPQPKNSGNTLY
ncbi:MAG: hypothetical protein CVU39_07235 [Chloroflexi bacterium HGW-Chloroflexi-10]|nr:MAG: hypothetical protein CVU39_07235 [Chloroflexi bacterium HGW-Chloroflexi-10]